MYIYIYIYIYICIHILCYIRCLCLRSGLRDGSPQSPGAARHHPLATPGPPTKSFPTKSPRVELSGRPPIRFNGHENSHPLELRVCLSRDWREQEGAALSPRLGCGMVWYGMVWYGMVWYGMVWYGMVWYGMVWYGMVWYGMVW